MKPTLDINNIKDIVRLAIQEDIGRGDITSKIFIPEGAESEGTFVAKEDGIIAGIPVAEYVLSQIDEEINFTSHIEDGSKVERGMIIAKVKGPTISLLTSERLVLNFMQRLSGIATLTNKFAEKVKDYKTCIMDTRKTIPGWRHLEKYAVKVGGGVNHRTGLHDQILIKDNHLKSIETENVRSGVENLFNKNSAIHNYLKKAREQMDDRMLIEVEIEDLNCLNDVLNTDVDIIMFDNMAPSQISEAVRTVRGFEEGQSKRLLKHTLTEASGNITLENVEAYAKTGVDRISVGTITHSAFALDISLDIF